MSLLKHRLTGAALLVAASFGLVAAASSSASQPVARSAGNIPITASSFNVSFSAMKLLKPLAAKSNAKVAAILPDTVSSTRYVEFDAPYIKRAFRAAGLSSSQIIVQNAQGSDATQLSDAQNDITNGATVLLVDPLDSGVGAQIENYAKAHGVPVIDYDRLTLGGQRKYYVSFNNVTVGKVMGQGFVSCVTAWKVKKPNVVVMHGATTDNNATLFYQGYYNGVLAPLFNSHKYVDVAHTAGTWDAPTALTEFQGVYTAHPNVNSALIPNDTTAAPIINYLRTRGVKPHTFPTTGQDASLTGLQNILAGYQCGTVYKPIYLEAQAAAALAMFLRAHKTPPAALVNGSTQDTTSNVSVKSVLEIPKWVTTANMEATVIKDKFVPAHGSGGLCTGSYAGACHRYGIH
jgi:D-xylose transport system substrate-binding protein